LGLAGILLAGLALFTGLLLGWVWPILSIGLAWGMTIGGAISWRTFMSQSIIQRRIIKGRQQLMQLETELAQKQHEVRDLETQLHAAQDQTTQSATVIEGLQALKGGVCRQLEISQAGLEKTRRQIDGLQEELENLRQQVPAPQKAIPLTPVSSDNQAILQECASLQILTRDPLVIRVFQDLKKAAVTQSPILLLGETGTGKEIFAKAAHALSPRHGAPFISVNMAAIRSELFEGGIVWPCEGSLYRSGRSCGIYRNREWRNTFFG
jgi:transcriptional regulator with PAS, ATPase and Fis domain